HVGLCSIFGRISRFSNAVVRPARSAFLSEVQAQLNRWWADLISPGDTWGPGSVLVMMYHTAVILFRRVAYGRIEDTDAESVAAAAAVTRILDLLPGGVDDAAATGQECRPIFPMVIYGIMSACTVWVWRVQAGHPPELAYLRTCIAAFKRLSGISATAAHCEVAVRELLLSRGIRIDDAEAVKAEACAEREREEAEPPRAKPPSAQMGMGAPAMTPSEPRSSGIGMVSTGAAAAAVGPSAGSSTFVGPRFGPLRPPLRPPLPAADPMSTTPAQPEWAEALWLFQDANLWNFGASYGSS
ncbi:hypothetical protein BDK51DRAFT_33534, partial [Blyttiomyces helicus]